MRSFYCLLVGFVLLALALSLANASCDSGPLQDYCVATNEPGNVFINGKFCKNPRNVTAKDFKFSGLDKPGNTNNSLGYSSTERWVTQVPGLNTLSTSVSRADYAPRGGLAPPHLHPRSSQNMVVIQGTLRHCFVASRENNYTLFCNNLKAGDGTVTPKALPHFTINIGHIPAVAYLGYGGQNPGYIGVAESSFATQPPISNGVLKKANKISEEMVNIIKGNFRNDLSRVYM